MDIVFLLSSFAFFATAFIYGLLTWMVWQRRAKTESDWVFLIAMAALAVWCLSNGIVSSFGTMLERPTNMLAWVLLQISYPLLYIVPPAIRHCMVLSRLSHQGWKKWTSITLNYLGILPVVLHLLLSSRPLPEHYGPAFSGVLFLYLPLVWIEIRTRGELRTHYAQHPASRSLLRAGFGGALVLAAIPSLLCLLYPRQADWIGLVGKFGALPPALAIAYGVLRYRFMDIVLTRGLLYSILGGLCLGAYCLVLHYGGRWVFPGMGLHPVAFAVGAFALLFILHFFLHVIRDGVQKAIEHSLFRHRRRSEEMLKRFSQTLTSWSNLQALCEDFTERVTDSLGLSYSAVLFADGAVYGKGNNSSLAALLPLLSQTNAQLIVAEELREGPLRSACQERQIGLIQTLPCREQRGWLILGEKRSGRPFFSQESALIEAVSRQCAVAIDNIYLVQAKIALEREMQHREKLASIGQLAATIAHEIRNPITGAKCLLQQVEDELGESVQGKEYVRLALEDLGRVEHSVSQLLTFARKEDYQFHCLDITALARSTVHKFMSQAHEKNFSVQPPEGPPLEAAVDEDKLRRTLLNLLSNAADAVTENGIITVSIQPAGPEVKIRVSDNGKGLTPGERERIFEPFFTTKEKGTGLGLAIAKKIIEGHGGHIIVVSAPHQGTTFTITIPRQRPEAKAAA
jgi:signal transduction histidine kinase